MLEYKKLNKNQNLKKIENENFLNFDYFKYL